MALQNRMMTLVAFLQAQNCSNLPGSWRHPATMLDFLTPEYYQRIAGTLEDGGGHPHMKRRELMLLTGDQADLDRVADTEDNRGGLRPAMTACPRWPPTSSTARST